MHQIVKEISVSVTKVTYIRKYATNW